MATSCILVGRLLVKVVMIGADEFDEEVDEAEAVESGVGEY